jgi:hypothetical protein
MSEVAVVNGQPVSVVVDMEAKKIVAVTVDMGDFFDKHVNVYEPDPDKPGTFRPSEDDDLHDAVAEILDAHKGKLPAPSYEQPLTD